MSRQLAQWQAEAVSPHLKVNVPRSAPSCLRYLTFLPLALVRTHVVALLRLQHNLLSAQTSRS